MIRFVINRGNLLQSLLCLKKIKCLAHSVSQYYASFIYTVCNVIYHHSHFHLLFCIFVLIWCLAIWTFRSTCFSLSWNITKIMRPLVSRYKMTIPWQLLTSVFCVCSGVSAKTNGRPLNRRAFWMIRYWMTYGRKPACRSRCFWVWWRSLISCAPPTHRYHAVTLIISKCH